MIQRIQSIFLFLAAACGFGVLAGPFATTSQTVQNSTLFADAKYGVGDNVGLLILFALAGVLTLAGLFLFKNRPLQMKLVRFAVIADVIGLVLAVLLLWQDHADFSGAAINDGLSAYLPFGFILFCILALRFIKKDEDLVKSMDRLR
ncbi:MAG: DUF4293 domain-containing protein [Saprospiraceae bacterium]|nr:DUF4293 domain-containing protein [Saprospiraceae bacterium]